MSFIAVTNPTNSVVKLHPKCKGNEYTFSMNRLKGGKWLAHHRETAGLTQEELAERVGISPSYVSAIERDEPNARDGSPRRPKVDKVDKIAKVLKTSTDEARLAFGYAPTVTHLPPRTVPELLRRLEELGVEGIQFFNGLESFTEEDYADILDDVRTAVELNLARRRRHRPRLIELEIQPDERDVNESGNDEHREGERRPGISPRQRRAK